jgi:hypothetical protein
MKKFLMLIAIVLIVLGVGVARANAQEPIEPGSYTGTSDPVNCQEVHIPEICEGGITGTTETTTTTTQPVVDIQDLDHPETFAEPDPVVAVSVSSPRTTTLARTGTNLTLSLFGIGLIAFGTTLCRYRARMS